MKTYVDFLFETVMSESRHGVVKKSTLDALKRWDAPHALDVKDEVDARDGDLDNAEVVQDAARDVKFKHRMMPKAKAGAGPEVKPSGPGRKMTVQRARRR